MKRLAVLAATLAAATVVAAPLKVFTENNPPFNYAEGKEVKGTATETVRAMLAKAGVEATITVLPWSDAYSKAQRDANTCVYSTARVENREKLFKWIGPIATNAWALYGLPSFDKKLAEPRDARFYKVGGVKNDAKVEYLRDMGVSAVREAAQDKDNPPLLLKPKTDPAAIDLWVTSAHTAKAMAAAAGIKDLKEVLVLKPHDLYLACNPRTDKGVLEKLEAAARK